MRKTESSSERSKLKIFLILIALLAYPVLIHFSLESDRPLIITGMWLGISAIGFVIALRGRSTSMGVLFGFLLAAGLGLWWTGEGADVMFLPPVLINVALLVVFARTLQPGSTPLVARVAELWRGELDAEVARYTRRVTVAWTVFFAVMALESAALALFAPVHIWSFFTNGLNYVFVLLFFVVEYRLRFYCLPAHEHLSFGEFYRLLVSADVNRLAR